MGPSREDIILVKTLKRKFPYTMDQNSSTFEAPGLFGIINVTMFEFNPAGAKALVKKNPTTLTISTIMISHADWKNSPPKSSGPGALVVEKSNAACFTSAFEGLQVSCSF